MGLDSFANCKVWLETTNAAARMTYATLATEEVYYDLEIPVVMSSKVEKPDGDKPGSGKGSVETGDSAPTGLLASMLVISALGMVSVVIGKKKRR